MLMLVLDIGVCCSDPSFFLVRSVQANLAVSDIRWSCPEDPMDYQMCENEIDAFKIVSA